MGTSYQDIDSRLQTIERLMSFVMNIVQVPVVTSALDPTPRPINLASLYKQMLDNQMRQRAALQDEFAVTEVPEDTDNG